MRITRRGLLKGAVAGGAATLPVRVAAQGDEPPGPVARYIENIARRPQRGGEFAFRASRGMQGNRAEARTFAYRSDDLTITGLACLPVGQGGGPWPVAVVNHGYFPFNQYDSGYDTLRELIFFASNGYFAIAPDYRNYAGSDAGENQLEPGYVYDVRNLLDALRFVAPADSGRVGMLGHSMGGGITQGVIVTTSGQVRAASLYGTVSGDETDNYTQRRTVWAAQASPGGTREADRVTARYGTPDAIPEAYRRLSPINYLDRVDCPVQIHHSVADAVCPFSWAEKLRDAFDAAGKPVELVTYRGQPHSFQGAGWQQFADANLAFFDRYVKGAQ